MTPEQFKAEDSWRRQEIQKSQREAQERLLLNEPLYQRLLSYGTQRGIQVVYNQSYVIFRKLDRQQVFRHYLAVRKIGEGYELVVYDGGPRLCHTSHFVVNDDQLNDAVAKEINDVQLAD